MKKTKAEANYREGSPMQLRDGGRKVTGGLIDLCFAPMGGLIHGAEHPRLMSEILVEALAGERGFVVNPRSLHPECDGCHLASVGLHRETKRTKLKFSRRTIVVHEFVRRGNWCGYLFRARVDLAGDAFCNSSWKDALRSEDTVVDCPFRKDHGTGS